tara:strand:+ start:963 stop:1415 length:453 start_codon:yes stop_codon:yes gene_type:complete
MNWWLKYIFFIFCCFLLGTFIKYISPDFAWTIIGILIFLFFAYGALQTYKTGFFTHTVEFEGNNILIKNGLSLTLHLNGKEVARNNQKFTLKGSENNPFISEKVIINDEERLIEVFLSWSFFTEKLSDMYSLDWKKNVTIIIKVDGIEID